MFKHILSRLFSLERAGKFTPSPLHVERNHYWKEKVPSASVKVYDLTGGSFVASNDCRTLWSFAAAHQEPVCIRFNIRGNLEEILQGTLERVSRDVRRVFGKDYSLINHKGWSHSYKGLHTLEFVFSKSAYGDEKNNTNARQLILDEHGQASALQFGSYGVKAIDLPWADGISYVREGAVDLPVHTVFKGMVSAKALTDVSQLTDPSTVITGLFKIVPESVFVQLGGQPKDHILTDRGNMKLKKQDAFTGHLAFFKVVGATPDMSRVSYQIFERLTLTPYGKSLRDRLYIQSADRLKYILDDRSGKRFLEEVPRILENPTDEWSATIRFIASGMPMMSEDYLDDVLAMSCQAVQPRLPFLKGAVIPNPNLNPGEVRVPKVKKGLQYVFPGDKGSAFRIPVIWTEGQDFNCVGYSDTDCIEICPQWWKDYFKGDFDGDYIYLHVGHLVVPRMELGSPKTKTEGGRTTIQVVANKATSIQRIAVYDRLLDAVIKAIKAGHELNTDVMLGQIQGVIDSLKFDVQLYSEQAILRYYSKFCPDFGVPVKGGLALNKAYELDSIFRLFRGKISSFGEFAHMAQSTVWTYFKTSLNFAGLSVNGNFSQKYFSEREVRRVKWDTYISNDSEVLSIAESIRDSYAEFNRLKLSGHMDFAYEYLNVLNASIEADKEKSVKAIKHLWACMVNQVKGYEKSLNLFKYLPDRFFAYSVRYTGSLARDGQWDLYEECGRLRSPHFDYFFKK